jgi:aspartyl-tRNA(Asn)/glutamyl-tRNA(Gln) amidotransferase subunit B
MALMSEWMLDVGMEVHAELKTASKMFCRDRNEFGGEPNTRVSPLSLGLPGTLPVPNRAAVEMVIRTALALNCQVAMHSVFHRKHYFYPDLPKGYQISQYGETNPLGYHGSLEIPAEGGGSKAIQIRRVHLEEDTGKLMHLPGGGSGVDYNRAGLPLMEIVSGFPPDIHDSDEAREYLVQLRQILLYLDVCDGKMEEGSMRCEPNISVRRKDSEKLGTKTELKNLNSFRAVQLGVAYERERQIAVLEAGGEIHQETRGWNEAKEESYLMRVKESEQDYRYFPDPDLPPMEFTEEEIEALRATIPELPLAKRRRYEAELGLSSDDAEVLARERSWAEWFEAAVAAGGAPKAICNWMNGDMARLLNETGQAARLTGEDPEGREPAKIRPEHLVELTGMIESGAISGKIAKEVFEDVFASGQAPGEVVRAKGLTQISDEAAIQAEIEAVLNEHPAQLGQYLGGKEGLIGFFVGQVMKRTQGRANPPMVQSLLQAALDSRREP